MSVKGFQIDAGIGELNDVVVGSPPLANNHALIYNSVSGKWENKLSPVSPGLNDITDVVLTPTVGSPPTTHMRYEVLTYDDITNKWINETAPDAGLMSISTGTFVGGELQMGSGSPVTTVTVTAGEGFIVDSYTDPLHPVYTHVTWPEFTDVTVTSLAVADRSFFAITAGSPQLIQQTTEFTPAEHRDYIHVGTVGHANNTEVVAVRSNPHAAFDVQLRLSDLAEAIGAFNITGNVYSATGTLFEITKTAGETYRLGNNFHTSKKSPDITEDSADAVVSFNYSYRDNPTGTSFTLTAATTAITPNLYDNGTGTLAATPVNDWQVMIIKYFAGGAGTRIEYGQTTYGTAASAISAIPDINHIHNPAFAEGVIRGYLVVQQGSAATLSTAQFIEAGRFGQAGAAGSSGSSIFSSAYESGELGIALNTNYSAAHGLGVVPKGMQAFLRCKTASVGYAIGDEVEFMNVGASGNSYKGLYANATNIGWHTGSVALRITNRTNGTAHSITLANWKIILRAYA